MILFAVLVKTYKDRAWKSWKHEDGLDCFGGGWFIVGIDTPAGTYTYHYEAKDWNRFDCQILEKAKHWDGHDEYDVERLFSLVSDANKDEVIKCLINGMKFYYEDNEEATWGTEKFSMKVKDIFTWLEKQQKPVISEDALREGITHFGITQYQIDNWLKKYIDVEKQGKQKPVIEMKSAEESLGISSEKYNDIVNNCLYGESNSSNKEEPKFHESDWVVSKLGNVWYIDSFDNKNYKVTDINGNHNCFPIYIQDRLHLWTIKDAKDGDVLVASNDSLFIFAKIKDNSAYYYFSLCTNGSKEISDGTHAWETANGCHPATKEQRDTLFKAMADTGWEFDFEKKELKKIEQEIVENSAKVSESSSEEKDMCEYKKGFECGKQRVLKYPEDFDLCKKSVWSEEDEEHTHSLLDRLEGMCKKGSTFITTRFAVSQDIDWLKSLEERYTWKPSEGQLECLGYAIDKAEKDYSPLANNRIYLTLKALKKELEKLTE